MKKVISYILCVCLIITLFSGAVLFPVSAVTYSGICGKNLTWEYNSVTSTLTISGTGTMYNYYSSETPWQSYYSIIRTVVIDSDVTSIGDYAFYGFKGLESITIPDSITSIGYYSFGKCTGLKSITIPDSLISVDAAAFSGCTKLTRVNYKGDISTWCKISFSMGDSNPLYYAHNLYINDELVVDLIIPDSITSICNYAFYGFKGLESITIPDSITSIGYYSFGKCTGLKSITIPDSVTSIGKSAFYGCTELTSVTIGNRVTSICDYAFCNCTKLTSIILPDSVTSIGKSAFYDCRGLTSINIPDSVTSIGNNAFYNCIELKDIYYAGTEQQKANISIGNSNDLLTNADWHYLTVLNAKSATCTEAGYTGDTGWEYNGEVVLYGDGEAIMPLGHDYNAVVTNPTCTAQGYTAHTCSRCGNSYKDNYTYMPCGADCGFIIEGNTLDIHGSGDIDNYKTQGSVPWYDYADSITEIIIDEGITKIGSYAFYCLSNLKRIKTKNNNLTFGKYAINNTNTDITVFAENGGNIETYCAENGINYIDPTITPELEAVTANSVTVKAIDGYEYSLDSTNWQSSNVFTGLSPASEYNIYARYAESADIFDKVGAPLNVTTLKLTVSAPAAPDYKNHTDTSVTLVPNALYEFSIGGENWQKSNVFTGLSKNTIYRFYQRVVETETEYASPTSASLIIAMPDKPEILEAGYENILLKKIDGFEYCLDDYVWQDSDSFDMLIDNTEYYVYQRLKAVEGEKTYQITSDYTAVITDNSIKLITHTPGDINGDGAVNNKDLTRFFQYLSDWDVEVNEAALDINGDGSVNNKDLARLFQYLSDWDVEIL